MPLLSSKLVRLLSSMSVTSKSVRLVSSPFVLLGLSAAAGALVVKGGAFVGLTLLLDTGVNVGGPGMAGAGGAGAGAAGGYDDPALNLPNMGEDHRWHGTLGDDMPYCPDLGDAINPDTDQPVRSGGQPPYPGYECPKLPPAPTPQPPASTPFSPSDIPDRITKWMHEKVDDAFHPDYAK